jgi:hypothetical protein
MLISTYVKLSRLPSPRERREWRGGVGGGGMESFAFERMRLTANA